MALVCFSILKAVLTRLLFAGHCLITVCRVVDIYDDGRYWLLLSTLGLLIIESFITLGKRKGRELKWFCPSFLIFLCGVVPGIWFLELDRLDRYRSQSNNVTEGIDEVTNMYAYDGTIGVTSAYPDVTLLTVDVETNNTTGGELTEAYTTTALLFENITAQDATTTDSGGEVVTNNSLITGGSEFMWNTSIVTDSSTTINNTNNVSQETIATAEVLRRKKRDQTLIPPPIGLTKLAKLDPDMWVNSIEQSMLLLLIIGRWLLPKGDITRDQLSQLLFVYIGMASDIMELYHLFEEPEVIKNEFISLVILGVWSLSLLQFTLVLTTAKKRRAVAAKIHKHDGCCNCSVFGSEIWSILVMVFFQDGPFLAVRLYVTITFKLFSYNIVFFTAKNALIVMLQFYRLSVIICHEMRRKEEQSLAAYSVQPMEYHESLTNIHIIQPSPQPTPQPNRIHRNTATQPHGVQRNGKGPPRNHHNKTRR